MKLRFAKCCFAALLLGGFSLGSEDRLPPGLQFSPEGMPLISPVNAPFVLKIKAVGYALKQAKLKDSGKGVYFMFSGNDAPALSLWVEPPGHCPSLSQCKEAVAGELRNTPGVKSYAKGNAYVFEYTHNMGKMKLAHLRIEFFVAGYWIDVHISEVNGDTKELARLLPAFEFSQKP